MALEDREMHKQLRMTPSQGSNTLEDTQASHATQQANQGNIFSKSAPTDFLGLNNNQDKDPQEDILTNQASH